MKKFIILLALLLIPISAQSQTITRTIKWDHVGTTLSVVSGYNFSQKIDAAAATAITPLCVQGGSDVNCSNPITLTSGTHTIIITAINGAGSTSGTLNYNPGAVPIAPTNITITLTITVP